MLLSVKIDFITVTLRDEKNKIRPYKRPKCAAKLNEQQKFKTNKN